MMHIAFNTDELTAEDRKVLALLSGTGDWPSSPATAEPPAADLTAKAEAVKAAPKKTAAPKAEPVKEAPAPEPEPVVEEDLLGGEEATPEPEGPTMADAVAAATKLVSSGGAAKVKEALAAVGAKRVSEVPVVSIAEFLDALK